MNKYYMRKSRNIQEKSDYVINNNKKNNNIIILLYTIYLYNKSFFLFLFLLLC